MSIIFVATAISLSLQPGKEQVTSITSDQKFKCTREKFNGIYPFSLTDVHTSIQYANIICLQKDAGEELQEDQKRALLLSIFYPSQTLSTRAITTTKISILVEMEFHENLFQHGENQSIKQTRGICCTMRTQIQSSFKNVLLTPIPMSFNL